MHIYAELLHSVMQRGSGVNCGKKMLTQAPGMIIIKCGKHIIERRGVLVDGDPYGTQNHNFTGPHPSGLSMGQTDDRLPFL